MPYVYQTAMTKKDKKSKDAEKKARVAAKQSKKTAQKEKRVKTKRPDDSDAEHVDLDSVQQDYAKQLGSILAEASWSNFKQLTISASPIPQSHGDSLRTSILSLVGDPYWFTFQREGAFSFWGRVLQWRSCHVFQ